VSVRGPSEVLLTHRRVRYHVDCLSQLNRYHVALLSSRFIRSICRVTIIVPRPRHTRSGPKRSRPRRHAVVDETPRVETEYVAQDGRTRPKWRTDGVPSRHVLSRSPVVGRHVVRAPVRRPAAVRC